MAPVITCTPAGLSPRVRVTRPAANPAGVRRRIIPACAGNTLPRARATCRTRDHPRVCGEHETHPVTVAMTLGSSPRVRGTPVVVLSVSVRFGIIPACAGNTQGRIGVNVAVRDHPRVCGEHETNTAKGRRFKGSSPRVRGTQVEGGMLVQPVGIIPACAGNTRCPAARRALSRDHPRVCGEHPSPSARGLRPSGSSPRVRGTLALHVQAGLALGIIPACAGNTWSWRTAPQSGRDHPRVCGEHQAEEYTPLLGEGSSPRVRGTQHPVERQGQGPGIIPACAGNTEPRRNMPRPKWDHPRVCGEHSIVRSRCRLRAGSSPRVRGTLGDHLEGLGRGGIIPACAGNTGTGRRR